MANMSKAGVGGDTGPLGELGTSGLIRTGGFVQDEFLPELQGKEGAKTFREMSLNDDMIGGGLAILEQLARQAPTGVKPYDSSPQALEDAEFLRSVLGDMSRSWESVRSEIFTDMLTYGWVWTEKVYKLRQGYHPRDSRRHSKYDDGLIGIRKLATRAQDTLFEWVFDQEGGVQAMVQIAPPGYSQVTIPIAKSLLFRTRIRRGSPEGHSILRNAYVGYFFKKRIREVEGIAIERELAGMPVMTAAQGADPWNPNNANSVNQLAVAKKMLRAMRADQLWGALLPHDWKLTLMSASGTRNIDTVAVVNRYNAGILISMICDLLLVGHEKSGSFALNLSKARLLAESVKSYIDVIHEVLNAHFVPQLFVLNGKDPSFIPELIREGDVIAPELADLAAAVADLTGAGWPLFPDEAVDRHLRGKLQLPPREEGEEVPPGVPPGVPPPGDGDGGDLGLGLEE